MREKSPTIFLSKKPELIFEKKLDNLYKPDLHNAHVFQHHCRRWDRGSNIRCQVRLTSQWRHSCQSCWSGRALQTLVLMQATERRVRWSKCCMTSLIGHYLMTSQMVGRVMKSCHTMSSEDWQSPRRPRHYWKSVCRRKDGNRTTWNRKSH